MSLKVKNEEDMQVDQITGADLLVDTLINEKVDTIFGYPGGRYYLFTMLFIVKKHLSNTF